MDAIIVAGAVIIEGNKVLLVKEKKPAGITPWFFPGGIVDDTDLSLEETCKRETKEEVGFEIDVLHPLAPLLLPRPEDPRRSVMLIHYLAKRKGEVRLSGSDIVVEYGWFDIDNLPKDCAPNIKIIIQDYLKEKL